MLKHPNVISARAHVRLDHSGQRMIYVIKTDLALEPDDPDFDEASYSSLARAALLYLEQNPGYTEVRLERVDIP
jgi:hypothetical protein